MDEDFSPFSSKGGLFSGGTGLFDDDDEVSNSQSDSYTNSGLNSANDHLLLKLVPTTVSQLLVQRKHHQTEVTLISAFSCSCD